jgi:hypothetical protein
MALNASLDVSFDDTQKWKRIRENEGDVKRMNAHIYIAHDKIPVEISAGVTLVHS